MTYSDHFSTLTRLRTICIHNHQLPEEVFPVLFCCWSTTLVMVQKVQISVMQGGWILMTPDVSSKTRRSKLSSISQHLQDKLACVLYWRSCLQMTWWWLPPGFSLSLWRTSLIKAALLTWTERQRKTSRQEWGKPRLRLSNSAMSVNPSITTDNFGIIQKN